MEHHRFEKQLAFGEVLDVTFRIIKENFSRLFLIMLILMGPPELLQCVAKTLSGASLLRATNGVSVQRIATYFNSFQQAGMHNAMFNIVYSLLLILISVPIGYAALIIATDQIRKQEPVKILFSIKSAFSRYWALLGGFIVFIAIMFAFGIGILIIFGIIMFIIAIATDAAGAFSGLKFGTSTDLGIIYVVGIIVLTIITYCAFLYFMIRWSFFFAAIVFEKVSPGLSKSWKLTRGNFWRLVGLYIVLAILLLIISLAFQMAVILLLGNSVLAYLLVRLVSITIMMASCIAYTVVYFDLRVRNEAVDLKRMIETYPDNTNLSSSVNAETKPIE